LVIIWKYIYCLYFLKVLNAKKNYVLKYEIILGFYATQNGSLVVSYRCFGTACLSHNKGSSSPRRNQEILNYLSWKCFIVICNG